MNKGFFREIIDKPKLERLSVYGIGTPLAFILLWVYTAIPSQEKNALLLLIMLIVWGFSFAFDLVWSTLGKERQMSANGLGKDPLKGIIYGVIGFFLFAILINFLFDFSSIIVPFSIVETGFLSFFFVVVCAPIVEANFFRGFVQPLFQLFIDDFILKNEFLSAIISIIIVNLGFAFFHVNIIGGLTQLNLVALLPYFIFGVFVNIGVYASRSIAFEYSMHGLNNLFAWFGGLL